MKIIKKIKQKLNFVTLLLILLLILPTVYATEVAELDFRILVSDDDNIIPVLIDINNLKEEEFNAEVGISMMDYDFNPGSMTSKEITITKNQELIYMNLSIDSDEKQHNVLVYLIPEEGMPIFKQYNSLMRFDPDFLESDYELTPSPVNELREEAVNVAEDFDLRYTDLSEDELEEALQRDYPEYFGWGTTIPWMMIGITTTVLGLITFFILALVATVIIIFYLLRK